ncbi:MAG: hypothetical protein KC475_07445 [Cyanobacteria bacterium HKST-UBA03]|nr:hypothetical protein [Cyanobacteria bacterium HKST-UBA03]
MPTPEAKARMALKHAGFWGGMTGTVVLGHRVAMWRFGTRQPVKAALTFAVGATLPMLGYWGGKRLARVWFPTPTEPVAKSLPVKQAPQPQTFPMPVGRRLDVSASVPPFPVRPSVPQPYGPPWPAGASVPMGGPSVWPVSPILPVLPMQRGPWGI